MSVVVTMRVAGDTTQFLEFVGDNQDWMRQTSERARSMGCLHHRFAVGDGFVMVIDEWESPEQFQQFFADPDIGEIMQRSGAQGEPQISIGRAIATADQF